jgi:hypothetical protein
MSYYDSFIDSDEDVTSLRGIPPHDTNPESPDICSMPPDGNGSFRTFMGTANSPHAEPSDEGRVLSCQRRNPTRGKQGGPQPIGTNSFWKNNLPVLLELKFNKVTIQVPALAPKSSPAEIKSQIHIGNVNAIRQSSAPWSDRAGALEKVFRTIVPGAVVATEPAIHQLVDDITTNVFEFRTLSLLHANSNRLDPWMEGDLIPADSRERCIIIAIELWVNPGNCTTIPSISIDPAKFPSASNAVVYLLAPATPPAWSTYSLGPS